MWLSLKRWLIAKLMAWLLPEDLAAQQEWRAAYEREQKVIANINAAMEVRADEIKAAEARAEERQSRIVELETTDVAKPIETMSEDDVVNRRLRQ